MEFLREHCVWACAFARTYRAYVFRVRIAKFAKVSRALPGREAKGVGNAPSPAAGAAVTAHVRQHQRVTKADRLTEECARQFAREPPRVTHYIAAEAPAEPEDAGA